MSDDSTADGEEDYSDEARSEDDDDGDAGGGRDFDDDGTDGGYRRDTVGLERPDNEYYNFLNVPRDASEADINAAYKKLSRLYHPDKHLDPNKKKEAEMLFAKLKVAHEVLIDPRQRAIYDCLGKKGLKEQGWQIVQRTKTPREIREEYEQLAKERAERRLQQRTNPTSRLQMTINAADLFERSDDSYDIDDDGITLPTFEISEITFNQTIDCPLTNADTVVVSGNASASNGRGHGSVGCAWRKVTSEKSWREVDVGLGNGPHAGAKYFRRLNDNLFANLSGSIQLSRRGLKPLFNLSFGNQLGKHTVGYLTYSANWRVEDGNDVFPVVQEQSGMSTMLVHNTSSYHLVGSIQFGIPYTYVMLNATRKFEDPHQGKLRAGLRVGTFGAILEYGVERRITHHSTLGATMVVGFPVGVTLRIKLNRGQQTYIFPVRLADEVLPEPIFYGTITPLIVWFSFKKFILDPYEREKKQKETEKQKESQKARVEESRKVAMASVDLMKARYERILDTEKRQKGLVVILALYGKLVSSDTTNNFARHLDELFRTSDADDQPSWQRVTEFLQTYPQVIDVTIPVQCLVEDKSKLTLYEGSKAELAGFFNPTPHLEEDKHLLVRYLYQGSTHQVMVADEEAVKLPKSSHKVRR